MVENNDGFSSISIARLSGHPEIADFLQSLADDDSIESSSEHVSGREDSVEPSLPGLLSHLHDFNRQLRQAMADVIGEETRGRTSPAS